MKKLVMSILIGMVLCGAASTAMAAIEVSGDAYVGIYSQYVWRGVDQTPTNDYSLQGGTDVSFKGFTIGFWGAYDEQNANLLETDIVLDYSTDFGEMVSASIGNIHYSVAGGSTNELYLAGTLNTMLSPTLTFYWDYHRGGSTYTTLGASHDIEIDDKTSLGLGAQISYLDAATNYFNNVEVPVTLSYAVTDQVGVDASFLYSGPLTDDARDGGVSDEFVFGLATTLTF